MQMKTQVAVLLLLLTTTLGAQSLRERIERVENGLTFPRTLEVGQEIITTNINQRLADNNIHGASVAVVSEGKIDWTKAYGVTEAGSSNPVTTETLFQCASIGKVITAIAVLKLVDEGKIELDENVNNKLLRWRIEESENTATQKVTLRHLLSHSAGLTDDYGFPGYTPGDQIPTVLQILNNDPIANTNKNLEVKAVPGKVERYSGAGYLIIQLLIEDLSGLSFADYVQQNIFDQLKMLQSTYDYELIVNGSVTIANGHLSNGKPLKNKKYHVYPEQAAAGPWTTAEDLAKLILGIQQMLKGEAGSILSQELAQTFLTAQINNKGLGVNLKGVVQPEAFWHAGQNLGYTALFYGLIEKGEGAVILLNSDGGESLMQEFISSVAMEYNWPVMQTYEPLEIPDELVSDLVGKYRSADQSKELAITEKKGLLYLAANGSKKGHQLYRISSNDYTFKDAQDYYRISFNVEGGNYILVYAESIGKVIELEKIE